MLPHGAALVGINEAALKLTENREIKLIAERYAN